MQAAPGRCRMIYRSASHGACVMLSSVFALALLTGMASGDTALTLQAVQHRLAEIGPTATVRELAGAGRWAQDHR